MRAQSPEGSPRLEYMAQVKQDEHRKRGEEELGARLKHMENPWTGGLMMIYIVTKMGLIFVPPI